MATVAPPFRLRTAEQRQADSPAQPRLGVGVPFLLPVQKPKASCGTRVAEVDGRVPCLLGDGEYFGVVRGQRDFGHRRPRGVLEYQAPDSLVPQQARHVWIFTVLGVLQQDVGYPYPSTRPGLFARGGSPKFPQSS
jgi:hypothetical protein